MLKLNVNISQSVCIDESDFVSIIKYAEIWHGDHDHDWMQTTDSDPCEVYEILQRYRVGEATAEEVIRILNEVDDEWYSSWLIFKNEQSEKDNIKI